MINIEIINDNIAIIKIKNFEIRSSYTYEIYGDKGYNISGKVIIQSGNIPYLCFDYNKNEYYFIKIIKNNEVSYSRFFNPTNTNNDKSNTFVKNVKMKIEKSFLETDIDNENEDDNEDNNDSDDEDKPEIISLEDIASISEN